MEGIEAKYNIEYVYGKRYYIEDLTKRSFNLKYSTPYMFVINDKTYFESSWKKMIFEITSMLIKKSNKSQEECLSLKQDWGNQVVFSRENHKNYELLPNGLYLNLNHTAVHDMWTLQLLLNFFNVDLSRCKLLIKRNGMSEPEECRKYFRVQAKGAFKRYLILEDYEENQIEICIKNIDYLNRYMSLVSKAHDDVWLFDDPLLFNNYKKDLINYLINKNILNNQNKIKAANSTLNVFGKYLNKCYSA